MTTDTHTPVEEADTGLGELLNRVERGEEVTSTRAGRPIARMIAAPPAHDAAAAKATVDALFELCEKIRAESGPVTMDEILELIREGRKH